MIKSIIALTVVSLCFLGCSNPTDHNRTRKLNEFEEVARGVNGYDPGNIDVFTIDSCEYVVWEGSHGEIGFTHKGNCEYCLKRLK